MTFKPVIHLGRVAISRKSWRSLAYRVRFLVMSTAFHAIDGSRGESLNDAAARRLRGSFAELRISASAVARQIGMTQAMMSRRTTGHTEFTLNELHAISEATGISLQYILLGIAEKPRPKPDGGTSQGGLLTSE